MWLFSWITHAISGGISAWGIVIVRVDDTEIVYTSNERTPEIRLWRAVLARVLTDAIHPEEKYLLEHKQAISWIKSKNRDFRNVCYFAGYDWRYVHRKAIEGVKKVIRQKVTMRDVLYNYISKTYLTKEMHLENDCYISNLKDAREAIDALLLRMERGGK
jgi:hypothetical protein